MSEGRGVAGLGEKDEGIKEKNLIDRQQYGNYQRVGGKGR